MKKYKRLLVVLFFVLSISIAAITVAASGGYPMIYFSGTTDTVTNMPQNDSGMRGEAYNVSSTVPEREGYEFLGWELNHDAEFYTVTYVVKPDPVYGMPEDVTTPTDTSEYIAGDAVTVAAQLTTTQDFGINSKTDEKRPGHWEFIPWDKADFEIYENTVITGEWKFIYKFKYTVHHFDMDTYDVLAADEVYWLDELGPVTAKSKKPATEFFTEYQKSKYNPVTETVYRNKREYFLLPGATYVKNKTQFIMAVTLTEDDMHIFFFYQRGGGSL